jgi:hypothetical protein
MAPGNSVLETNRDLYLFVAGLRRVNSGNQRSLEEYLRALWRLGSRVHECVELALPDFARLLEAAFIEPVPAFDPSWLEQASNRPNTSGYGRWEDVILSQVVDLHEMREANMLANDLRYFGLDAPRGSRWYNFDPLGFLECGVAGSFDGWQPGDDTERDYVPGPVAILDDAGKISSADPRTVDSPTYALPFVSWDTFADFLRQGQWYE